MIRVFVVDDSVVARAAFRELLSHDARFELVGQSSAAHEALDAVPNAAPDIVLMDVYLPRVGGIELTKRLLALNPVRVVLVSDASATRGKDWAGSGALQLLPKPRASELRDPAFRQRWLDRLAGLARISVPPRREGSPTARPRRRSSQAPSMATGCQLVAIGASTGGPRAIAALLQALDATPPWPILIAQHALDSLMHNIVQGLQEASAHPVALARQGEPIQAGHIYVAPANAHLTFEGKSVRLVDQWSDDGAPKARAADFYPSVNALFTSIARSPIAESTTAILLTGMGSDGATGLKQIREAGGWTIAESQSTSVVFGMPARAIELGAAAEVLPLPSIALRLAAMARVVP